MTKNRLEAFSDGVFAIILTILVLELKVPEIKGNTHIEFLVGLKVLLPKFISFAFSFFIIAIFWVNHHHILHQIEKTDTKLLWLNTLLLFFCSLFPFITAFIGDYYYNPYVVALYPLNMLLSGIALRKLWKYCFIESDLAPNLILTDEDKKKELKTHNISAIINVALIFFAFVYIPFTLAIIMIMPIFFVAPGLLSKKQSANR